MKKRLSYIGGMITAFLSVSCCIGPALFLVFGITGLGFFSGLTWLRPYFLVITFVFVGIAYYYAYGKGSACELSSTCKQGTARINRVLFWLLVGFAVFGVGFPYLTEWLFT